MRFIPALLRFIGKDALAAHNASFDQKFLLNESQLLKLKSQHSHLICSLLLARRVLPQLTSYKLSELARSLNIRFAGQAHRAEADAEVTVHLINHLANTLHQQHHCHRIDADLLVGINQQTAAKVPAFLKKQTTGIPRKAL